MSNGEDGKAPNKFQDKIMIQTSSNASPRRFIRRVNKPEKIDDGD